MMQPMPIIAVRVFHLATDTQQILNKPGRCLQVVALLLRSSAKVGDPLPPWHQEHDFASMLNRVLPDSVRVLGWADVPQDFHARYIRDLPSDCQHKLGNPENEVRLIAFV